METRKTNLADNLKIFKENLERAAQQADRKPEEVKLIAVSKTYPASDIKLLAELGQKAFGENRVQELQAKMADPLLQDLDIEWHLIGTLQRNKAKHVVGKVSLIHSVNTIRLLKELQRQCDRHDTYQDILLQVNVAQEESKHGFDRSELGGALDYLEECPRLRLRGLMCMAPYFEDSDQALPIFKACAEDFRKIQARYDSDQIDTLSMGMSSDYVQAIEAGATEIRIGSSIFGERSYD